MSNFSMPESASEQPRAGLSLSGTLTGRTVASVAFRLNGHLRDACLRPRFGAEPLSPGKSIPSAVPGFRLANQSGYSSVRSFSSLRVWLTLLFLPVAINEGQHLKDIRISWISAG